MNILHNEVILKRQSENYIKGELSNVAAVIAAPQILVDYFSIDADASTTTNGLKTIEDYLDPSSTLVLNHIAKLPMAGIDNLVSQSNFDEEIGFDETFESSGMIFPNTIQPKPNDLFMIPNAQVPAIYVVTDLDQVTVRSNPFIGIQFRLLTRNPELIKQLWRQVKDEFETTVTAIGPDKSLVIHKRSLFEIKNHVDQYIQLVDLYFSLFYSVEKAAFVFDGLPGIDGGGCIGYQEKTDLTGFEDSYSDPDHPYHNIVEKIKNPKNGDVINERGDRFYIVDGEPVVVPGYVPYWLVRNHTDRLGDANSTPYYNTGTDCCCYTCNNFCCDNSACKINWTELLNSDEARGANIVRQTFIDITLWQLMFEQGLIIFDDVVTYAINNFNHRIERYYTDSPDLYIDDHMYKRSVLYKLASRDKRHDPFKFIHPQCWEGDPRITKFQGKHIYYLEYYDKTRSCTLNAGYYNIWDREFIWRLMNNVPYPEDEPIIDCGNYKLKKLYPFNTSLRNAIIHGYNNDKIDWDNITIENEISIENYTLIPILLKYYKDYIEQLQK